MRSNLTFSNHTFVSVSLVGIPLFVPLDCAGTRMTWVLALLLKHKSWQSATGSYRITCRKSTINAHYAYSSQVKMVSVNTQSLPQRYRGQRQRRLFPSALSTHAGQPRAHFRPLPSVLVALEARQAQSKVVSATRVPRALSNSTH